MWEQNPKLTARETEIRSGRFIRFARVVRTRLNSLSRLLRLGLTTPFALAFVLAIRLLRPMVVVRIGALKSERIGHFVHETELMILEQRIGLNTPPSSTVDVYYVPVPVSNRQIETMWKRVLRVFPRWIMVPTARINRLFPGWRAHVVPTASGGAMDIHNLFATQPPLLQFTSSESRKGARLLDSLGLEPFRYVCVIARDPAYYRRALPQLDLSYHSYRNCDIDTYVEAMEALAETGLTVLRMGAHVEKPLRSSHPRLIDYANSSHRGDFADVLLSANCKFCVSDGLGFFALPAAFRRPNVYVNFSPFYLFRLSRPYVGITKQLVDVESSTVIPLSELEGRDITQLVRTERLAAAGFELRDNSSEEIKDLVLEANARLDGTWVSDPNDELLQSKFWERYERAVGDDGMWIHGESQARFGAKFLRDNRAWLGE